MIKKIGSNKYGVVEYAISSVEDIADLPLGVAIGSTAVLIDKDGIRTFALGEGEWVEYIDAERYDKNKLAQDLLFCGFGNDGEKHDDLDDRLMVEFDEINERVNVGNYLEYNGCDVKADYSLEGLQRGMMLEGRTLQNLIPTKWVVNGNVGGHATYNVDTKVISVICDGSYSHVRFGGKDFLGLIKADTIYTICFKTRREGSSVERYMGLGDYHSEGDTLYTTTVAFTVNAGVTQHMYSFRVYSSYKTSEINDATQLRFTVNSIPDGSLDIYDIVLLEGDYTQTPIEELPFIEGIESVGESELTDDGYKISGKSCGKNLFNINSSEKTADGVRVEIEGNTLTVTQSFEGSWRYYGVKLNNLKLNTTYTFSATIIGESSCRARIFDIKAYKEIVHFDSNNGKVSFTPKINLDSIWAFFYTSYNKTMPVGTVAIFKDIMLEEDTTVTPYEPYQETTYSYILDEPLRSLPNGIRDTIDLETGVVTRRVGRIVVDGSESWHEYNTDNESYNEATVTFSYRCGNFYQYNSMVNNCPQTDTHRVVCIGERQIYYRVPKSVGSDIESFKQWLRANPTTILYELTEPTIHQLDQNRIYSFKDTTHVVSDNLIAPRITTNILTNSNALISHLRGENLALANEVSTLSLRNRETQETNETQDHIIDASLCAVDELYMMYETTQEVEVMSADEEGSRMVDMYVAMVQRGLKTIDQVPVRYREKVREILAQLED